MLPKYIERMEQKKKLHNLSARVVEDIKTLEDQQTTILKHSEENTEVLEMIKQGIEENEKIIRSNAQKLGLLDPSQA
jgi:hypothetical protein